MLKAGDRTMRNGLIERLKEEGVETAIGTVHMPLASYFRYKYGYQEGDFPVTDHVAAVSLALPLHEQLSAEDQENIVNGLMREIVRLRGAL
jgi:perosamine synthetase